MIRWLMLSYMANRLDMSPSSRMVHATEPSDTRIIRGWMRRVGPAIWTFAVIGTLIVPIAVVLAPSWRVRLLPAIESSSTTVVSNTTPRPQLATPRADSPRPGTQGLVTSHPEPQPVPAATGNAAALHWNWGIVLLAVWLLGAVAVSWVSQRRPTIVYYRDAQKKLHPLDAVEGDGLERAIALYFSSEPMLERQLLGQAGVEARWRMPTFSLAIDKMIASVFTLCSGGAGGLEASVTLVGESTAAGLFKPRGFTRKMRSSFICQPIRCTVMHRMNWRWSNRRSAGTMPTRSILLESVKA